MTETKLYDKVYGAVMGFAVGDALGVPVEEMHYRNIRKQYGEVRRMLPVAPRLLGGQPHYEQSINHGDTAQLEAGRYADPFGSHDIRPGSYSDDTRYLLLCARAVVHYGRRITSLEFAQFLTEYVQNLAVTRPADDLERTSSYEGRVDYFLFDTKCDNYGGSGKQFDWSVLEAYTGETPFLLSGGLRPESAGAIRSFHHPRLAGIDLNSGFEIEPGLKDVEKLKRFIHDIKQA